MCSKNDGQNIGVMKRIKKIWRGYAVVGVELEKICDPAAWCANQRSLDLIQGAADSL